MSIREWARHRRAQPDFPVTIADGWINGIDWAGYFLRKGRAATPSTDQERYIAFLDGIGMKYQLDRKSDVMLLPTKEITYVNWAAKVTGLGFVDAYFAEDGHMVALARPEPDPGPPPACDLYVPDTSGPIELCATCKWSESAHGSEQSGNSP